MRTRIIVCYTIDAIGYVGVLFVLSASVGGGLVWQILVAATFASLWGRLWDSIRDAYRQRETPE